MRLLSLLSSCVNATNLRPTVLSTASQGRACGPPPRGLPLLQLSQACKGSTQARCEAVWLWCAHPIEPCVGRALCQSRRRAASQQAGGVTETLGPEKLLEGVLVCENPSIVERAERNLFPQHCRLTIPLPATRGVPDSPKPLCGPGHCQTDRRGTDGGLHRAERACRAYDHSRSMATGLSLIHI